MQRLKFMLAALVALPLAALACDRQPAATREPAANEANPPAVAMPAGQGADAVQLGTELGPDGDVTGNATSFRAGEPVFAEIQASSLPPGASVRLAWVSPQGATVSTDELVLPPEARAVTLKAKDTSGWVPGDYRVDVAVGGAAVGSRTFRIAEAGSAD